MSSFSPLASILKDNKLTDPNFIEWKKTVDIVLPTDGYKYVLMEPCVRLGKNPTPQEIEVDLKWKKDDTMAKCYLLASMSPILQSQHEMMPFATDIMYNLSEMFMSQARPVHQKAINNIMNTKMAEGTPVKEHMLKMIAYFSDAQVLGADIVGET